jgi:hypothetical protein
MGRRILRMDGIEYGNFFRKRGGTTFRYTLPEELRCFARHFTLGSVPSGYFLYTYSC